MAFADYTELSSITEKRFIPALVDNIFTSNVLLMRMKKRGAYVTRGSGGTSVVQPLAYATTSASAWYDGTETLDVSANDQIGAAEFDWKQIHAAIPITGRDESINQGREAIVNFVASKTQLAEMTIVDNVGTGLYNDGTTDSKAIIGLRLAVDSAGTYGGINRTTYSWWSAQEDSSTTALSLPLMQGIFGDCSVGNDKPTLITCNQDVYDLYWAKLQPQQRWTDKGTADAGFTNLMFNGAPVVVDGKCPSAHMFFINEKYLKFHVMADKNFKFTGFVRPTNQDVHVAQILWMGALSCSNCRMQGKLGAIAS